MVAAVLLNFDDVDILLLAAKMILAKHLVDALGDVVESPVHAINKEVYVEGIDSGIAYLTLHAAGPDITGVLCPLTVAAIPVLPGVAEVTAQHQLVVLARRGFTEERILQRLGTVLLLEYKTEGVLRVLLGQTTMTTMQTDAAGRTEVMVLRTAK